MLQHRHKLIVKAYITGPVGEVLSLERKCDGTLLLIYHYLVDIALLRLAYEFIVGSLYYAPVCHRRQEEEIKGNNDKRRD